MTRRRAIKRLKRIRSAIMKLYEKIDDLITTMEDEEYNGLEDYEEEYECEDPFIDEGYEYYD